MRRLLYIAVFLLAALPAQAAPGQAPPPPGDLLMTPPPLSATPDLDPALPPASSVAAAAPAPEFHSLESVLQWSYRNNPQLLAARAAFRATEEALPQARAGYQPTLAAQADLTETHVKFEDSDSASASTFGGSGKGFSKTKLSHNAEATATQPLYRGGQTVAAVAGARALIESQRAVLHGQEQQILLQAATAYMDVVRDQSLVEVDANNARDLAEQLKASQNRFDAGEITRTDVSQAQAAQASAQANLIRAAGNLKTSRAVFEKLVGFAPGLLGQPQVNFPVPPTLEDAATFAENSSPQIIAARALQKSSQADIDRLRGQLLPELSLIGDVLHAANPQVGLQPDETVARAGLQANWTLYEGGADRSRVRQAKFTANQRTIDILSAGRDLRQQVVSAWETRAAVRAEIASRQAQVDAARLAAQGTRSEAEVGSRTLLDALDSEQAFLNAQVALLEARRDETVASFTLAATLGLLTPKVLGFPE